MELLTKLRIKKDKQVCIINLPDSCRGLFDSLDLKEKPGRIKHLDQLIIFATDSKVLAYELNRLAECIGHDTLLWLCYPKKSGSVGTSDLGTMKAWEMVFSMGYRGQSSAAIDNNWSALRVTNAPPKKPSTFGIPAEERKIEGIDFVNRTVQLPADALAAVKKHKGMDAFFMSQSFTCKKEYVVAITDAKKEETRKRRIDQMVDRLQQKMHAKSVKATSKK